MFAEMPLETVEHHHKINKRSQGVLTRDVCTVGELLGHHRVHGDHHVSLLRHVGVALLHLLANPLLERLIDHGGADVDDPLLRRLGYILIIGEEVFDLWHVSDELQDLLDGERLVLRHVEVLDLVVEQVLLLLVQDVLKEVDGRVVYTKEAKDE